jgi:hypothetical protein
MEGDPPNYEYWCEKCGDISIEEMHKYWNRLWRETNTIARNTAFGLRGK